MQQDFLEGNCLRVKTKLQALDFKKQKGLIPVVIQEEKTGEVLMLGYMNKESLELSLKNGYATFWSRSKKKLWMKGETSGNKLKIKEIFTDCDQDTLLINVSVEGNGVVCHTGNKSCFFEKLEE
ncbi:MAG: phosphoribosyl-AMP cyclohydrolase [Candidatus Daviesbacteria bacterium]